MSTSYKSLFPSAAPAPVEVFQYPESNYASTAERGSTPPAGGAGDEVAEMLLRAHSSGVREGEERERARGQEQLHQERERISQALRDFENSVTEYFSRTEVEVVELALQIASKILQREAQADPKLMAKLVHALLEKLHQNTRVKVRVRPEHLARWRSDLAALNDGQTMIDILEDESVAPGGCVLETELGTTEISLDAQFAEVANGLFDLLARPKSSL